MIRIEIDFKDGMKFDELIRYIENANVYFEAQAEIPELGEKTAEFMKKEIETNRKRPDKGTHKLENAIESKVLNTTAGVTVGIGEIARLKVEAPYFEVLNDGGYIPNHGNFVPLGAFSPGEPKPNQANFRDGQWQPGAGKYTFQAKRPIEGINYINKAIINLDRELRDVMQKLGSKFIEDMKK